jgi:hypothetical protein
VVIADAAYTRWPGDLVLVSADGELLQPESVAVQLQRARAAGDAARIDFLERHLGELV